MIDNVIIKDNEKTFNGLIQLKKNKQIKHKQSLNNFEKIIDKITETLENDILDICRKIRQNIEDIDDKIESIYKNINNDDFLLELNEENQLVSINNEISYYLTNRLNTINELKDLLYGIEKKRCHLVNIELTKLINELINISYLLPNDIEFIIENESHELNAIVINNKQTIYNLYTLFLFNHTEKDIESIHEYELSLKKWRELKHNQCIDRFLTTINSNEYVNPIEKNEYFITFKSVQYNFESQRSELFHQLINVSLYNFNTNFITTIQTQFNVININELQSIDDCYSTIKAMDTNVYNKLEDLIHKLKFDISIYGFLNLVPEYKNIIMELNSFLSDDMSNKYKHEIEKVIEIMTNQSIYITINSSNDVYVKLCLIISSFHNKISLYDNNKLNNIINQLKNCLNDDFTSIITNVITELNDYINFLTDVNVNKNEEIDAKADIPVYSKIDKSKSYKIDKNDSKKDNKIVKEYETVENSKEVEIINKVDNIYIDFIRDCIQEISNELEVYKIELASQLIVEENIPAKVSTKISFKSPTNKSMRSTTLISPKLMSPNMTTKRSTFFNSDNKSTTIPNNLLLKIRKWIKVFDILFNSNNLLTKYQNLFIDCKNILDIQINNNSQIDELINSLVNKYKLHLIHKNDKFISDIYKYLKNCNVLYNQSINCLFNYIYEYLSLLSNNQVIISNRLNDNLIAKSNHKSNYVNHINSLEYKYNDISYKLRNSLTFQDISLLYNELNNCLNDIKQYYQLDYNDYMFLLDSCVVLLFNDYKDSIERLCNHLSIYPSKQDHQLYIRFDELYKEIIRLNNSYFNNNPDCLNIGIYIPLSDQLDKKSNIKVENEIVEIVNQVADSPNSKVDKSNKLASPKNKSNNKKSIKNDILDSELEKKIDEVQITTPAENIIKPEDEITDVYISSNSNNSSSYYGIYKYHVPVHKIISNVLNYLLDNQYNELNNNVTNNSSESPIVHTIYPFLLADITIELLDNEEISMLPKEEQFYYNDNLLKSFIDLGEVIVDVPVSEEIDNKNNKQDKNKKQDSKKDNKVDKKSKGKKTEIVEQVVEPINQQIKLKKDIYDIYIRTKNQVDSYKKQLNDISYIFNYIIDIKIPISLIEMMYKHISSLVIENLEIEIFNIVESNYLTKENDKKVYTAIFEDRLVKHWPRSGYIEIEIKRIREKEIQSYQEKIYRYILTIQNKMKDIYNHITNICNQLDSLNTQFVNEMNIYINRFKIKKEIKIESEADKQIDSKKEKNDKMKSKIKNKNSSNVVDSYTSNENEVIDDDIQGVIPDLMTLAAIQAIDVKARSCYLTYQNRCDDLLHQLEDYITDRPLDVIAYAKDFRKSCYLPINIPIEDNKYLENNKENQRDNKLTVKKTNNKFKDTKLGNKNIKRSNKLIDKSISNTFTNNQASKQIDSTVVNQANYDISTKVNNQVENQLDTQLDNQTGNQLDCTLDNQLESKEDVKIETIEDEYDVLIDNQCNDINDLINDWKGQYLSTYTTNYQTNLSNYNTFQSIYQKYEDFLCLSEGFGLTYGQPRRTAQEAIHTEIYRNDIVVNQLDLLLDELIMICSSIDDCNPHGRNSVYEDNKLDSRDDYIQCFYKINQLLVYLKIGFSYEIEYLQLWDKLPSNQLSIYKQIDRNIFDISTEISLDDCPFNKLTNSETNQTIFQVFDSIEKQCINNTIELFKKNSKFYLIKDKINTIPDSLTNYLLDCKMKLFSGEGYHYKVWNKIFNQVNRFESIIQRKIMYIDNNRIDQLDNTISSDTEFTKSDEFNRVRIENIFIGSSGSSLYNITNAYLSNLLSTYTLMNQQINDLILSNKTIQQQNDRLLKPRLRLPYYLSELIALHDNEMNRSISFHNKLIDLKSNFFNDIISISIEYINNIIIYNKFIFSYFDSTVYAELIKPIDVNMYSNIFKPVIEEVPQKPEKPNKSEKPELKKGLSKADKLRDTVKQTQSFIDNNTKNQLYDKLDISNYLTTLQNYENSNIINKQNQISEKTTKIKQLFNIFNDSYSLNNNTVVNALNEEKSPKSKYNKPTSKKNKSITPRAGSPSNNPSSKSNSRPGSGIHHINESDVISIIPNNYLDKILIDGAINSGISQAHYIVIKERNYYFNYYCNIITNWVSNLTNKYNEIDFEEEQWNNRWIRLVDMLKNDKL